MYFFHLLLQSLVFTPLAVPVASNLIYDKSSWNSQCSALTFRSSSTGWQGKSSDKNQIGVTGGGWNTVHVELTSRTLNHDETFKIVGTKQQVGVGLCIDSCDLESSFGIRWEYNCIGFYGDGTPMLATDQKGKEYAVPVDRSQSRSQGFTYNQSGNCVTHIGSRSKTCTPLPEHFRGKAVRAIGQVWNSASGKLETKTTEQIQALPRLGHHPTAQ